MGVVGDGGCIVMAPIWLNLFDLFRIFPLCRYMVAW